MRAMTFERLVRDERFASEVATTAVGAARPRPADRGRHRQRQGATSTGRRSCWPTPTTARSAKAPRRCIHGLAVPFVGFEDERATDVKPDFVVVARQDRRHEVTGQLADRRRRQGLRARPLAHRRRPAAQGVPPGRARRRVRSRRGRSCPAGMDVHRYGVARRAAQRVPAAGGAGRGPRRPPRGGARCGSPSGRREADAHALRRDDDAARRTTSPPQGRPSTRRRCTSCTLFSFCRDELRASADPTDLLIEIGVPAGDAAARRRPGRRHRRGRRAPASVVAHGHRHRSTGAAVDDRAAAHRPGGPAGTVNVVIAKSDAAALGVHGIAVQRVTASGPATWTYVTSSTTRSRPTTPASDHEAARQGDLDRDAQGTARRTSERPSPVHLVVPDKATADVLVSIADNLAGIELSRLRWERDKRDGAAGADVQRRAGSHPADASARRTAPRSRSCSRRTGPVR